MSLLVFLKSGGLIEVLTNLYYAVKAIQKKIIVGVIEDFSKVTISFIASSRRDRLLLRSE